MSILYANLNNLVWLAALLAGAAWPASSQAAEAGATSFAGAETCAGCHPSEFEEWQGSKHAGAFSQTFRAFWQEAVSDTAYQIPGI